METTTGASQAYEKAPITAERGDVMPVHIFWLQRREIDDDEVARFVNILTRDGQFINRIAVRAEGAGQYRLIAGLHRLEAWKHYFGEQQPIPATIYPPDTPDALIEVLEFEENLRRKELNAAQREAQTIRLVAALKKLDGEKPATELSVSGSNAKPATRGGRGKKAATARLADRIGLSKAGMQKRIKAVAAAIGEEIDPDLDTPEELERKADKRQHAGRTIRLLKPRKPAPVSAIEDPAQPAKPQDAEIEDLWKAFDAIGKPYQLRFVHDASRHLGLDPLKMAPPAAFGLTDEEPELDVSPRAEVAPATEGAVAEQAEQGHEAAVAQPKEEDEAALAQADQGNDGGKFGAEDLQDAGDDAADAVDPDVKELPDADDDDREAADQDPGGAMVCAYCTGDIESSELYVMIDGRPYHRGGCVEWAKQAD